MRTSLWITVLAAAWITSAASAQEWGTLKGQIVFDGTPPTAKELAATAKDKTECVSADAKILSESLVVDPASKGIANIVVTIYVAAGGKKPPLPPGNDEAKKKPVVLDNKGLRFEPQITLAQVGQPVVISNSDKCGHNTKAEFGNSKNESFNLNLPTGAKIEKVFGGEERLPAPVACNIHPYMKSWIVVRESPYMAVTDKEGKFEMKVPAGEWTFQFWQEKSGFVTDVKVGGKKATWAKGRLVQKIKAGDNDLGTVLAGAAQFNK